MLLEVEYVLPWWVFEQVSFQLFPGGKPSHNLIRRPLLAFSQNSNSGRQTIEKYEMISLFAPSRYINI